jgi:hypothetical protein
VSSQFRGSGGLLSLLLFAWAVAETMMMASAVVVVDVGVGVQYFDCFFFQMMKSSAVDDDCCILLIVFFLPLPFSKTILGLQSPKRPVYDDLLGVYEGQWSLFISFIEV